MQNMEENSYILEGKISAKEKQNLDKMQNLRSEFALQLMKSVFKEDDHGRKSKASVIHTNHHLVYCSFNN